MRSETINISFQQPSTDYDVKVGLGLLARVGKWARDCLGPGTQRVVIVSNPTIFNLYGERLKTELTSAGFTVLSFLMEDGEQHKTLRTVEAALESFAESGLARTDAVIALGGGVVGDAAGFAASIYLRGIPFLQVPTTLLAMIDSSVGGKTGVNSSFGKNRVGAFHQPLRVLIDPDVLVTLPPRELTAGFCEMVKHGAIGGRKLLDQTDELLRVLDGTSFTEQMTSGQIRSRISSLVAANVAYKASIVAGDPRESSTRTDSRSRKILNFGHTLAHALEKVTNYQYFKHGEAVGYGIIFAARLSKELALIDEMDVNLLNDVVHRCGHLPRLTNIDAKEVFEAFKFDKKHLSGSLQMVLLKGIGKPAIVSERDIPRSTLRTVLKKLLSQWA